jgi:hypothetical protein
MCQERILKMKVNITTQCRKLYLFMLISLLGSAIPVDAASWVTPARKAASPSPEQVWRNLGTGIPSAREDHTAVWTGSEMIVWGGHDDNNSLYDHTRNDGAIYSPTTKSWNLVSTTGAPFARDGHTAVWTGSEMIVWGDGMGMML